jgi:ubiquinol-cytochrome c reductase cytochrome b subunit
MAEAFMGYLLPWGNMSYWGAQVIISLFGAIPVVGEELTIWIKGDYVISGATLNRFFALHVIALPLVLVVLVFLHILALHEVGSNNPDGTDIKKPKGSVKPEELSKFKFHDHYAKKYDIVDAIPFHPYYSVKDIMGVAFFLILFCWVMFFAPEGGGYFLEAPNFTPANGLKTPEHIAPVWYFGPFYTILRVVPDKLLGTLAMFGAIAMLFALPWFDRGTVKSLKYRCKAHTANLIQFAICFFVLGYLGGQPATPTNNLIGTIATFGYFGFFIALWFYSKNEKTKPVPERVTK